MLRVRHRTGHDVPTAEIVRRWTAVQDNLARTAPLFANILLLDNSGDTRGWSPKLPDKKLSATLHPYRGGPLISSPGSRVPAYVEADAFSPR